MQNYRKGNEWSETNKTGSENMLVAILGLGVFFGMVSGVVAVIAGQSFLTALAVYICVGMMTSLITAIAILVFDSLKGRKVPHRAISSKSWL